MKKSNYFAIWLSGIFLVIVFTIALAITGNPKSLPFLAVGIGMSILLWALLNLYLLFYAQKRA